MPGGTTITRAREAGQAGAFYFVEKSNLDPAGIVSILDRATDLLVDQQDVTPLGLAYQAIELQTTADPLDVALRRVLRAMKV